MKILILPRPQLGDFVLSLYSDATKFMPPVPIHSKMATLPSNSPALKVKPETDGAWFYRGDDAQAVYDAAVITMGEGLAGIYERDYEAIREAHPDRNLKSYWELTDEERGIHFRSYAQMQQGFNEIAESIRNS